MGSSRAALVALELAALPSERTCVLCALGALLSEDYW